jgi:tether containing UBX domain for GLUT4
MSISLNVLCPNARRTQIKVQPNTKVLEIIEEVGECEYILFFFFAKFIFCTKVCKKQGFDPSEYCLIHQKKTLDITLSFRLTGVPNNGHLELQKLEGGPRIFNDVTLVLQLDDGSRLSAKSFPPNTTSLENVINAYKSECELLQCVFNEDLARETETFPICIYLTEQIIGMNQLRNTTLKDLGLLNGRGIIRFSFKNLKMDEFEKLEQEFNLKLCKKIKLEQVFLKQKEEQIRSLNNKQETDTKGKLQIS